MLLTALGLSACGADTSMLGKGGLLAEQATLQQALPISRMVSYRPAAGPPDEVGKELSRQLNDAAVEQGIALVIDPNIKLDLALRGYASALRNGSSVNITYLWDVIDSTGNRVYRIAGEEPLVNGVDVKHPWTAVTPAVSRMIAQRTMADLGQWIRSGAPTTPDPPAQAVATATQ